MPANDFTDLDETLRRAGAACDAAETHGTVCGVLCAGMDEDEGWMDPILDEASGPQAAQDACRRALRRLCDDTRGLLRAGALEFAPLLPDDEAAARADHGMVLIAGMVGAILARLRELASVREEPTETVITLSGEVLFERDRATLRATARDRLTPVADALRATGETAVIAGYTDSRGSDEYNRDLSQRRADAVRDALVAAGVAAARITTQGLGESQPVASNDTDEGRAKNRRVDVILLDAAAR